MNDFTITHDSQGPVYEYRDDPVTISLARVEKGLATEQDAAILRDEILTLRRRVREIVSEAFRKDSAA